MSYIETAQTGWPILALIQLLPLIAAILLIRLRGQWAAGLALVVGLAEIGLIWLLYQDFSELPTLHDGHGHFYFAEQLSIWGVFVYHAAVDGMAIAFMIFAALIHWLSLLFVIFRKQHHSHILAVMLLTQAVVMSQLLSMDLLWFLLMSCIEVILIAYLARRWATDLDTSRMLNQFLQFMGTGLFLLMLGICMLGWAYAQQHNGIWSFNLLDLQQLELSSAFASLIFFLLFYGVAIRIPLFPLHGWLPNFIAQGNVATASVLFLGIKVGIFALIHFVLPILPEAVLIWQNTIIQVAIFGIFYAAFLAMRQTNIRRLLAFAIISHTSLLIIGLFSLNQLGFTSSILLSLGFGFAISGMLWSSGMIRERTKTLYFDKLGGLFDNMPVAGPLLGISFMLGGITIIGMPGTLGFEGIHLMLEAAIHRFGVLITIPAALGNVVVAGFLLWSFQRIFLRPATSPLLPSMRRRYRAPLSSIEIILSALFILLTLIIGLYPQPWIDLFSDTTHNLAMLYQLSASPTIGTGH